MARRVNVSELNRKAAENGWMQGRDLWSGEQVRCELTRSRYYHFMLKLSFDSLEDQLLIHLHPRIIFLVQFKITSLSVHPTINLPLSSFQD